jgi:hypothetical protein
LTAVFCSSARLGLARALASLAVFLSDEIPLIHEHKPVAAHERIVERPSDSGWHLTLTPDARLFCGGTLYMPSAGAIATGDPPQAWQSPVAHADRRVGANRGAVST